jgi:hypothetical protein
VSEKLRTSPKKTYDTARSSVEPSDGFSPDQSARPRQPESWLGIILTATVGTRRSAPGRASGSASASGGLMFHRVADTEGQPHIDRFTVYRARPSPDKSYQGTGGASGTRRDPDGTASTRSQRETGEKPSKWRWAVAQTARLAPTNGGVGLLVVTIQGKYNGGLPWISPLDSARKIENWRTIGCPRQSSPLSRAAGGDRPPCRSPPGDCLRRGWEDRGDFPPGGIAHRRGGGARLGQVYAVTGVVGRRRDYRKHG